MGISPLGCRGAQVWPKPESTPDGPVEIEGAIEHPIGARDLPSAARLGAGELCTIYGTVQKYNNEYMQSCGDGVAEREHGTLADVDQSSHPSPSSAHPKTRSATDRRLPRGRMEDRLRTRLGPDAAACCDALL